MKFLSEPTKGAPEPRVMSWLRAKRTALETWSNAGVGRLDCLPWDADTGFRWEELPNGDSLIAVG